ncbi:glycosyltransferase family 4 protein [Oceanobacillus bengalensis]|uniref:Glycosyltransferase family 1 protein n=1 Tax=Oceanobacillus bengalensis TaxID=1435466 RepID=A0A494YSJ7_9BACI|nr:glycosyltransferase family 4 protein [Oceanobacillus bengalensis]RKQ12963.1 glycosyltransferase family 1 protein [Oceanobacillus bengalensis]
MKVLYVSTISNTINAFMIPHIELLLNQGHQVDIACNIEKEISSRLTNRDCKVFNIEFQRSPLKKQNFSAYIRLKKLIQEEQYDLVHTHTPIASALVRFACKKMDKVKVFYTAHGFHFFKGAPIKYWLTFFPFEYYLAKFTNVLITINKEDYASANRLFKTGKVEYIPGVGFDTKSYNKVVVDKKLKRKEIGVPEKAFIILSVGELNKNKNHETIIKALAKLKNPNIYYVICGEGVLKDYLESLVINLGIEQQVRLLGYRRDVIDICNVSDIFAFPSKREGLGMAALEAMASGLPVITSNVHGINDYSVEGVTGYKCAANNENGFATAIEKLYSNNMKRVNIGLNNKDLVKKFDLENTLLELDRIYKSNS